MHRLFLVFAGCICDLLVLLCAGSFDIGLFHSTFLAGKSPGTTEISRSDLLSAVKSVSTNSCPFSKSSHFRELKSRVYLDMSVSNSLQYLYSFSASHSIKSIIDCFM